MLDSTGFAALTARRPELYHLVAYSSEERLTSVMEHGLERAETRYSGVWRSRENHVYLADSARIKSLFFESDSKWGDYDLLAINTGMLDRKRINADEDWFATGGNFAYNRIGDKHACQVFRRPFPPCQWTHQWADYLKLAPLPSLGEWADQVNLGTPAETRYSIRKGSVAYNGVVPPDALRLVKTTREDHE